MAPDESRAQIAVWVTWPQFGPYIVSVVGCVAGTIRVTWKCLIWKGTRYDNFVLVWLLSWPESSQDPPPLFQIMLHIWQWPPTLFTCTCSLWIRRICRPICTVSLSQKSAILERNKEQTVHAVKCWSSIVKEQINMRDFEQWVWWNIIGWQCFIWDTKTMLKRLTHNRTLLLINIERFL